MFEKETRPLNPDYEQFRPVLNYDLAGRSFQLIYDDGTAYFLNFFDEETALVGVYGNSSRIENYHAFKGDETTYLVHIELKNEKPRRAITFIVDVEQGLTTRMDITNGFDPAYPRWSVHKPFFGAIKLPGRPLSAERHGFTKDLVGSKIKWNYFDSGALIHIYKEKTVRLGFDKTFQDRMREIAKQEGRELPPGPDEPPSFLFDEPSYYLKIKTDIYVVAFSEGNSTHVNPKIGGGDAILLLNTRKVMDGGRFFGLRDDGGPLNQMVGAFGSFYYEKLPQEDMPSELNNRRFTVSGEELTGSDKF
jgi:hypothetical protein